MAMCYFIGIHNMSNTVTGISSTSVNCYSANYAVNQPLTKCKIITIKDPLRSYLTYQTTQFQLVTHDQGFATELDL